MFLQFSIRMCQLKLYCIKLVCKFLKREIISMDYSSMTTDPSAHLPQPVKPEVDVKLCDDPGSARAATRFPACQGGRVSFYAGQGSVGDNQCSDKLHLHAICDVCRFRCLQETARFCNISEKRDLLGRHSSSLCPRIDFCHGNAINMFSWAGFSRNCFPNWRIF